MVEPTSLEHLLHCLILCLDVSVVVFAKTFRILCKNQSAIDDNISKLTNESSINDDDSQKLNECLEGNRQLEHLDICLLLKLINLVTNDTVLRRSLNSVKKVRNEMVHEFLLFQYFADVETLSRKKNFLIGKLNDIIKRTCDIAHLPILKAEGWQKQLNGDIQFISIYQIIDKNEMKPKIPENQEEILEILQEIQDVSIGSNAKHENGSSIGLLMWISNICFCVALIQFVSYEWDDYFQFFVEAGLFLFFKQKVFSKNEGTALSYLISLQEILITKILVSYIIGIPDYLPTISILLYLDLLSKAYDDICVLCQFMVRSTNRQFMNSCDMISDILF